MILEVISRLRHFVAPFLCCDVLPAITLRHTVSCASQQRFLRHKKRARTLAPLEYRAEKPDNCFERVRSLLRINKFIMTSFATILEEGIIEINSEAVEDDTNIIDATSVRDVNTNKTEVRFDSQVAGASRVLSFASLKSFPCSDVTTSPN